MEKLAVAVLASWTLCLATATQAAAPPKARWSHRPGSHLSLLAGAKPVWTLHFGKGDQAPFVHPLTALDGTVLTARAPTDHPWHKGLWFSWKFVDGVNVWDWAGRPQPVPEGLTQVVGEEKVEKLPDEATVTLTLEYSAKERTLLKEERRITVSEFRAEGSYTMDWRLAFTAGETPVVLERTPPKEAAWGGYGGLSFRAPATVRDIRVIDSEGRRGKAGHGRQARWVDFSGTFGEDTAAGVAMFDHPANPRHPTEWYIAPESGMAYFGTAFLFSAPYTLPAGKTLTFTYRVLVHPGYGEKRDLDDEFRAFKKTE